MFMKKNLLFILVGFLLSIQIIVNCSEDVSSKMLWHHENMESLNKNLFAFSQDLNGYVITSIDSSLYRIHNKGDSLELIQTFEFLIVGIHIMDNGYWFVSTDNSDFDPETPNDIYRSTDSGETFEKIYTINGGTARWWCWASDSENRLFMSEYGTREGEHSKHVRRSYDFGTTWDTVFTAPIEPTVHLHCLEVDPFTDDIYITYGDGPRAVYVSKNHGNTWEFVNDTQSTSITFTEDSIIFGEDKHMGEINILDRNTGDISLKLKTWWEDSCYPGSFFSLGVGSNGLIYAPLIKYTDPGVATFWVGDGENWNCIANSGPDCSFLGSIGWYDMSKVNPYDDYIYVFRYRVKEFEIDEILHKPEGLHPEDGESNVGLEPSFVWNEVENAEGYVFQISYSHYFSVVQYEAEIYGDTVHTPLYDFGSFTSYYWRIRAFNEDTFTNSGGPYHFYTGSSTIDESDEECFDIIDINTANTNQQVIFFIDSEKDTFMKMQIYNVNGRIVNEINMSLKTGMNRVFWDRRNIRGKEVSSGIYLVNLKNSGRIVHKTKFTVVK